MNTYGTIYKFVFKNNKIYIGQTRLPLARRVFQHERFSSKENPKLAVHRAWKKYGKPEISTVAIVELYEMNETEKRAIKAFSSYGEGGYNLTLGGDSSPMLNPIIVEKVRALAKTPERIAKNIAVHLGSKRSDECRLKMSEQRKGQRKGIPQTKEHIFKRTAHRKGIPLTWKMSEPQRLAISAAASKPKSIETRIKMSIAAKKRELKKREKLLGDKN